MPKAQNDFYHGLLNNNAPAKIKLFENALKHTNDYVRRAAADELLKLAAQGTKLSSRTMQQVRKEASGVWAAALDAAGSVNRERVLDFLLGSGHDQSNASFNEARLYTLGECEKKRMLLSESEKAAAEGHYLVSRYHYNEAMEVFRAFQENNAWPEQIPDLFIEYPILISDLGRAFQYSQTDNEGYGLFTEWEKSLSNMILNEMQLFNKVRLMRYRLLFFLGRFARRTGQNVQVIPVFERAFAIAPDTEQSDACIWYILDSSLNENSSVFIQLLEKYVPYWHSGRTYIDVLEKFLQQIVLKKEWENVIRVYTLIKDTDAFISKGSYAWIIGRTIEEKYLSASQMRLASEAAGVESAVSSDFMQIVYNSGLFFGTHLQYYRMMSADALGLPFLELPPESEFEKEEEQSSALQFLLGFFENGAEEYAVRYVRSIERELSPAELRVLSETFAETGVYNQSIRLVNLYINREGYTRQRRDLELYFPRHYTELVEKHAEEFDIAPSVIYGLMRQESAFQHAVVSHAGAIGLMQLMPSTARDMANRMLRSGGPDFSDSMDLTDPSVNVFIGTYHLDYLLKYYGGDIMLSLLAYNAGMNRVRRWIAASALPADLFLETVSIYETRDYGRKVLSQARIYKELYN